MTIESELTKTYRDMLHAAKISAAAVASAALLSASLATPARAATEWDLPLAWPDGNFHVENVKTFAKVVSQVTGGEVVINVHAGGSLGFKGPEMQAATGPMLAEALAELGDEGPAIIDGFFQEIGR